MRRATVRGSGTGKRPGGRPAPPEGAECLFCRRLLDPAPLRDLLIYEDGLFHVSHQLEVEGPTYLGLALIQTKRHARYLGDLTPGEAERLGPLIRSVSRAVTSCTGADWTYCYSFMEGVRHVHVLITARYPGTPAQFVRLDVARWPEAPTGDRGAVAELCARLRTEFPQHS